MTLAQLLEEQGWIQGWLEGVRESGQEAEIAVAKKIAIKLLQMGKSINDAAYVVGLPVKIVKYWAEEKTPT